ncbi:MAG: Rrf2 family transcriptional regulator [Planctomycetes bacterium]|nr:Rrf2 family transcriptional regulator [Planctomycetota bacterium]
MLKVPKKVEYGLISLLHMEAQPGRDLASRAEIARSNCIPIEILGKVLQALTRSGLVESVQGVKGGYRLARPIETIRIGQVIEAVDGPLHLMLCSEAVDACEQASVCVIRGPMARIEQRLRLHLYDLSLAELRNVYQPPPAPQPEGAVP